MALSKLSIEEFRKRYAELKVLFDANNHDDDKVLDLIADADGEFSDTDYEILRFVLADYQINYRSPPQDSNY